jgi:hypothetical protein
MACITPVWTVSFGVESFAPDPRYSLGWHTRIPTFATSSALDAFSLERNEMSESKGYIVYKGYLAVQQENAFACISHFIQKISPEEH